MIELAKSIKSDYDIVFLKSNSYDLFVENNGLKSTKQNPVSYQNVIAKANGFDFSWLNKKAVESTINNICTVIAAEKPDLIIGDSYYRANILWQAQKV